ncbi:MAG: helix-turn-helix transcriptional regulator [Thermomicrobiales bacterium]
MIRKSDNPAVRQRIGPTVKALRYQKKMSLNMLAEMASISPSHLSRIERGLTVPSYDVLDHIADSLGSDLSALRNEEESALAIDVELDSIFGQIELSSDARAELLRLSHETRSALARSLRRFSPIETSASPSR